MICQQCKREGKKSKVYVEMTTLLRIWRQMPYYDEDGNYRQRLIERLKPPSIHVLKRSPVSGSDVQEGWKILQDRFWNPASKRQSAVHRQAKAHPDSSGECSHGQVMERLLTMPTHREQSHLLL